MSRRALRWIGPGLLLLALITGCDRMPAPPAEQRAARLAADTGPIQVGLAWNFGLDRFLDGAELARRQINEDGGLLGRPLEFVIVDDTLGRGGAVGTALRVSTELANHPRLMAVIGHYLSDVAIPASVTYEDEGILFLAPSAFRTSLTRHGFRYTFRTIPNSDFLSRQQAIFAHGQELRRIAILETRESWTEELANAFETSALNLDLEIIFRRSFFTHHRDFRDIFADLSAQRFDAIFLASGLDTALRIVGQAREMGLRIPILVGHFAGLEAFERELSEAADSVLAPVVINPESEDPRVQRFINEFQRAFLVPPDDGAAQGYDAVMLMAHAIRRSASTIPLTVATTLRYSVSWRGVTGRHSFRRDGDIYTKMVSFSVLSNGEIDYISPSD